MKIKIFNCPRMSQIILCILLMFCFNITSFPASTKKVYYIPVNTEVDYGLAGFIGRAIKEAKQNNAEAIILGIDTFGGRVDACLDIVNTIDSSKSIPIYAFIEDKAWSAGALIALGCEKIFMRTGASMGSATPISGGVEASKALGEKHVSALRAKFRSVAEKNGYPPNLAAAMVDKDLEVKEVLIDNKKEYLTSDEIENKKKRHKLVINETITKKGKLLNLTTARAKKYGIATEIVDSIYPLLEFMNLGEGEVVKIRRNWAEHLAGFLTNSMISGLLLMVGLLAIYLEFSNPGFGWAGITGIVCLALLFWGKYITNLAEWTELIILIIGIVLVFLEIFVIPGFGICGITGIIFLAAGLYLAFVPFVIPIQPWDFKMFKETLMIILGSSTVSIIGFVGFAHYLPGIPGLNRLVLTTEEQTEKGYTIAKPEIEKMVGKKGIALTNLRPVGRARFSTKILDVVSETEYIKKGKKVTIVEVSGNRILVRHC